MSSSGTYWVEVVVRYGDGTLSGAFTYTYHVCSDINDVIITDSVLLDQVIYWNQATRVYYRNFVINSGYAETSQCFEVIPSEPTLASEITHVKCSPVASKYTDLATLNACYA